MADFIFRVSSVNLTAAQQQKIASAIQGAVLAELAQLDLGPQPSAADCLFRPIKWAGGIMIPLAMSRRLLAPRSPYRPKPQRSERGCQSV